MSFNNVMLTFLFHSSHVGEISLNEVEVKKRSFYHLTTNNTATRTKSSKKQLMVVMLLLKSSISVGLMLKAVIDYSSVPKCRITKKMRNH